MAGCLIFQEQKKKNASSQSIEQTPTNTGIAQPKKLVHTILLQVNLEPNIDITTLSSFELTRIVADVNLSRTNPTFFATSKAAPPPAVSSTYKINIQKGDPKAPTDETINLTTIEEPAWLEISRKLKLFHLINTTSSITLTSGSGLKTDLRTLDQQQLEATLKKINKDDKDMVTLSTSKSLAPDRVPETYALELTLKSGEKVSMEIENRPEEWGAQKSLLMGLADPNIYMDYSGAGKLVHPKGPFETP